MKKKYVVGALACLLFCLLCLALFFLPRLFSVPQKEVAEPAVTKSPAIAAAEKAVALPPSPEPEAETPYESPIDFAALQAENPDIYAWLSIVGTEISYPLVQNEDDSYYLTHDVAGAASADGALFTESAYNGTEMEDAITVVYGHHMKSGAMFGNLQTSYSSLEQLEAYRDIIVYQPERELHYQVFAAVPYDNRHIPYYYGDGRARSMRAFLYSILAVKSLDAVIDEENFAGATDHVLVLSTCLAGNRSNRFLVLAKLTETY